MDNWHTKEAEQVLQELKSSAKGISNEEVKARIEKHGLNKLKETKKRVALSIFTDQFKSVLVLLLVVATVVSALIGEFFDASAIAAILFLNAFLGFNQEYKAERALESLKKYLVPKIRAIRNGEEHLISSQELVPGDVVLLEEGVRVPADLRLIEVMNLKVDEAALTGESIPVEKITKKIEDVALPDRKNMAYMGTLISYGRSKGVVVATGMETEIGKIAKLVEQREEMTPLQEKLNKFGRNLGIIIIVIAAVLFFLGLFRNQKIFDMLLTSISLAIAAVPEGLPAVITLTLALGVQKIAKKNGVIKRLGAAETLGSTTVICADKTGTMTTNEMTVEKIFVDNVEIAVSGAGFNPEGEFFIGNDKVDVAKIRDFKLLVDIATNCNNATLKKEDTWKIFGDPTEGALKVVAVKSKIATDYPKENEIPFSSERKMMTTIQKYKNEFYAFSKGAPEIILSKSKVSSKIKEQVLKKVEQYASSGYRVLGFAYKRLGKSYILNKIESDLIFVGLMCIIDPARKETKTAIELTKKAGIRTIMITGDHKLTALAIAREVGLDGKVLIGEEVDKLSDEQLDTALKEINIFARVSPQHKLRIVERLRAKGEIVAVTGDGVNDAPALKKADIGVAMGIKGTEVSKEASDLILLDDNFSTIVDTVNEGRRIYENIKKFVRFLLSANFGEIAIIATTIILGLPLALLPLQLLWLNIATDGLPALALSVDPSEKDLMAKKPRGRREILYGMKKFLLAATIISLLSSYFIFTSELNNLEKARTMVFSQMVIFELFLVFNCRSAKRSVFRFNPLSNKYLILAVILSFLLQVAIIYTPILQKVFDTVALSLQDWVKVFLFSLPAFLVLPEIFGKEE